MAGIHGCAFSCSSLYFSHDSSKKQERHKWVQYGHCLSEVLQNQQVKFKMVIPRSIGILPALVGRQVLVPSSNLIALDIIIIVIVQKTDLTFFKSATLKFKIIPPKQYASS